MSGVDREQGSDNSSEDVLDLARGRAVSRVRAAAYMAATPTELNARDDNIVAELTIDNSSAKSKLGKLYRLLADASEVAKPFVACQNGCSACCKMNVDVTSVEAERLALVSGKRMARVTAPIKHREDEFSGVACPLLVNDSCSVYEARPFACRAHHSFDTSSYWCQPERAYAGEMGMATLGGAKLAYGVLAGKTSLRGFADIRDFFPTVEQP